MSATRLRTCSSRSWILDRRTRQASILFGQSFLLSSHSTRQRIGMPVDRHCSYCRHVSWINRIARFLMETPLSLVACASRSKYCTVKSMLLPMYCPISFSALSRTETKESFIARWTDCWTHDFFKICRSASITRPRRRMTRARNCVC